MSIVDQLNHLTIVEVSLFKVVSSWFGVVTFFSLSLFFCCIFFSLLTLYVWTQCVENFVNLLDLLVKVKLVSEVSSPTEQVADFELK